jgi:hypothetical protein
MWTPFPNIVQDVLSLLEQITSLIPGMHLLTWQMSGFFKRQPKATCFLLARPAGHFTVLTQGISIL